MNAFLVLLLAAFAAAAVGLLREVASHEPVAEGPDGAHFGGHAETEAAPTHRKAA